MVALNGFDANEVEPTIANEPIPSGDYVAMIINSEMKSNKAGTGEYLLVTFQICEGEFKDRLLWARLNLDNPNQQAVAIARSELSAICRAVGVMTPVDSTEMHHLPLLLKVTCKKRADNGEVVNEIKGYSKRPSASSHAQQAPTATPPWNRG